MEKLMTTRALLLSVGLAILAACGGLGHEAYCEGQGLEPGTNAFEQCLAREKLNVDQIRAREYRP